MFWREGKAGGGLGERETKGEGKGGRDGPGEQERTLEPAHYGVTPDRAEPWIGGHSGTHGVVGWGSQGQRRQAKETLSPPGTAASPIAALGNPTGFVHSTRDSLPR